MSREEPKKKERQKRQRILCVLVHVGRKLRVRLDVDIGGLGIELGSIPNSPMVLKWAAIQILMFGWLLHSVLEFAHLSSLSPVHSSARPWSSFTVGAPPAPMDRGEGPSSAAKGSLAAESSRSAAQGAQGRSSEARWRSEGTVAQPASGVR